MVFCLKKMWTISDKYNIIRWHYFLIIFKSCEAGGRVAKLADAHGSEPCSRKAIRVQVPSRPPFLQDKHGSSFFVEKKKGHRLKSSVAYGQEKGVGFSAVAFAASRWMMPSYPVEAKVQDIGVFAWRVIPSEWRVVTNG